ncbi:solute carrier family 4 member 1b (Diego blood group) [Neoarius graeffei]|uniref:solute carrier family 4 member 1b (Diego blood group) n=1 Tax=Neoarius graeffei TaxID=443677 RepID=UPI00298C19B6|nr:solute carrier family 4 member 1b (Diego blood group) [Neoarius graeffei]
MKNQSKQGGRQETGRWQSYKESHDPEVGHWESSHVSYLTFKSLVQLRCMMDTGVVTLDREEPSLSSIMEKIVDEMIKKRQIRPSDHDGVFKALTENCSQSVETQPLVSPLEIQTFSVAEKRDVSEGVEASMVFVAALDFLEKPTVAFVRLKEAQVLETSLKASAPVRFIFVLIGSTKNDMDYHETGRAMTALLSDNVFNQAALKAQSDKELNNAMKDFLDYSMVIPPTEIQDETMLAPIIGFQKKLLQDRLHLSEPQHHLNPKADKRSSISKVPLPEDPLVRTGIPFGGLIRDLRRRYKHYKSDITDAMNAQVFAAVIFIYFAALSPAITFGGLLADKVDNMMGVSELMLSTAVQGVIFCLTAAQPVLIIGFSGPLLVFEEAFYGFCKSQDIEYIVGRVWVGMWLIIIVVLIVAVEGSFLVRFISRFTQEIFSILISLIFIYETFAKLGSIFKVHPLNLNYEHLNTSVADPWHPVVTHRTTVNNSTGNITTVSTIHYRAYPNTALLSMCLMFGCFSIAYFLRIFKNGCFLPGKVRRLMGDFGVPIAIFLMVAVDININDTYTQKLVVPKGLQVSNPAMRGWLINPMGEHKPFPTWMKFACVVPAILVFILIFLESQITTLIVSKPERKMVKGSGFHLDLLILVCMGGFSAFFGMPWLSAATVRSVTHANALTVMSKGSKPEIEKVLEQRLSGVLVALLVGLSILMEPILKMIPMAALFGIFLYMGVTSLSGIQLWDRILLLLIPKKYHPNEPYAQRVKMSRMHMFTGIQIVCLAMLWIVKSSPLSLALPFILILTIPLRVYLSRRVFTKLEMKCLDAVDVKVTFEEEPGVDVYAETRMPS